MNDGATTNVSSAPGIVLWVIVICGLLYGVVETITKIPALFGA